MTNYIKRWVITHVGKYQLRRLTFAQQGVHTYETQAAAQTALEQFTQPGGLEKVLTSAEMATLAVLEVDCYPHGDPVRYYYYNEEVDLAAP